MRFIVYGAGAIGGVLGAKLHLAGHEVALIDLPDHVQAISEKGLLLRTSEGETRVSVPAFVRLADAPLEGVDAVFLATKSWDTAEAAHEFRAHLRPGTPVVCCQNGARNEAIVAHQWPTVYGGFVLFSGTLLGAGDVAWTVEGQLGIGRYPSGLDATAERIAEAVDAAVLPTRAMADVMGGKWRKVFANLNNATLAVLGLNVKVAQGDPEVRALMADVLDEGWRALGPILPPLEDTLGLPPVPEDAAKLRSPDFEAPPLEPTPELRHRASTVQDMDRRHGRCEARWFNGEVVAAAILTQVPVPLNQTLLELVEARARERAGPGDYSVADLRHLAARG